MRTEIADKRWAKKYPDVGTGPVLAEPCVSPEYFELERERVFRKVWLNVGRIEDVPKPGDYIVRNLPVCKASILIIHGKDGVIRGFHNVCSHRGNKVVWNEKGSCPGALSCGFHSWTFNTKGELTWVPDEENFFDLNKKELGLTPVHLDIWQGFLFINLDRNPQESLLEYLGGVANPAPQTDEAKSLPANFLELESFLSWALSKEQQRTAKRMASTQEEILAFYNAMLSRIDAITNYLKQFPFDGMPAEAETLFHLSLSLIEIANAVEMYKQPRLPLGFDPARFVPIE